MNKNKWIILLALLALGTACATGPQKPINVLQGNQQIEDKASEEEEAVADPEQQVHWVQRSIEGELLAGTRKGREKIGLSMNFEDIDVVKFINVMMTDVFKFNYLITDGAKKIKKKFSIKMTDDLPKDRAFNLFRKILNLFAIVIEKEENVYVFEKGKAPAESLSGPYIYGRTVPQGSGLDSADEVTFLVPFYNIEANKLSAVIGKYLSPQSTMIPVDDMNMLLLHGRLGELEDVLSLVNLMDRAQFKEKSILMITPRYWGIDEFSKKVVELLTAEGVGVKTDAQSRGLMLIPIENLNSLMVISPVQEWAERVLYWLAQLDIPEAAGEARKVYHYKLRNVEVESVEEVLKSYTEQNPLPQSKGQPARPAATTPAQGKAAAAPTTRRASGEKTETPTTATVMGIKETNSLVIIAKPAEYEHLLNIIHRVDIPRNQVFVEVIIGEITLEKTSEFGVEFWMNHYLSQTEYGTKGALGVSGGEETVSKGGNMTIKGVIPGLQYEVLLNALIRDEIINIISTPKVTVLENEEAEISVGADIPVVASQSGYITPGGSGGIDGGVTQNYPFQSINYINTGIILKVKPAILSNNNVSLKISQEISEAQTNETSDISSPEILKRKVTTTLLVQEGQIAFMGGLIQRKQSEGEAGVPLLSKIPILGNLFKKTSKTYRKTELVLFISAKIIQKTSDMKNIVERIKNIINQDLYQEDIDEKEK